MLFFIAIIDGFVWKDADVGFAVFMLLGVWVADVIGGVYQLFLIIRYKPKNIIIELIILWFTVPFYGFLGGIFGLLIGFVIF